MGEPTARSHIFKKRRHMLSWPEIALIGGRAGLGVPVWEGNTMLDSPHSQNNGSQPRQEMISGAFLRNAWYVAAWSDGVGDGQLVPRTIMNEPVVLFRKATARSRRSRTAAPTVSRRCTWARS